MTLINVTKIMNIFKKNKQTHFVLQEENKCYRKGESILNKYVQK